MAYFINNTRENFDIPEILELFNTLTPYGDNLKNKLSPYPADQEEQLKEELEELKGVIIFIKTTPREKLQEIKDLLMQLPLVELEIDYLRVKATLSTPMLFNLGKFLFVARQIHQVLKSVEWWKNSQVKWSIVEDIFQLLKITSSYSFYLGNFGDNLYQQTATKLQNLENELIRMIKEQEQLILQQAALQDKFFSDGLLVVGRNDEKLTGQLLENPDLIIYRENFATISFQRKETGAEIELKEKVENTKRELTKMEYQILDKLSHSLLTYLPYFEELATKIGRLDWLLAKGFFAINYGGTVPVIGEEKKGLVVESGIHPIVQARLKQMGTGFVPVSICLETGVAVLTGANMGGKTITLKTVGTLLSMAQMALPVTAARVKIKPVDFIFFSSTGEKEEVGLSSFSAEVKAVNEAIKHREKQGLVLLDELARGTNPEEGAALARAFLDVFNEGNCWVLATTHFDRLIIEEKFVQWQVKGLKNLASIHDVKDIYSNFDYGLEKVTSRDKVPRDAIKVARLMEVDQQVLKLADKYLKR